MVGEEGSCCSFGCIAGCCLGNCVGCYWHEFGEDCEDHLSVLRSETKTNEFRDIPKAIGYLED